MWLRLNAIPRKAGTAVVCSVCRVLVNIDCRLCCTQVKPPFCVIRMTPFCAHGTQGLPSDRRNARWSASYRSGAGLPQQRIGAGNECNQLQGPRCVDPHIITRGQTFDGECTTRITSSERRFDRPHHALLYSAALRPQRKREPSGTASSSLAMMTGQESGRSEEALPQRRLGQRSVVAIAAGPECGTPRSEECRC